jgi:hypothetical protein
MADEVLMRRDVPLAPGRKLSFRVTTVYEVVLDDDMLQDADGETVTVEQVEEWIADHKRPSTSDLAAKLRRDAERWEDVEHTVHLDDVTVEQETWRFELPWEKESRERGETWYRRSYAEIPAPRGKT